MSFRLLCVNSMGIWVSTGKFKRDISSKNENALIIYSSSCLSRLVWFKKNFWTALGPCSLSLYGKEQQEHSTKRLVVLLTIKLHTLYKVVYIVKKSLVTAALNKFRLTTGTLHFCLGLCVSWSVSCCPTLLIRMNESLFSFISKHIHTLWHRLCEAKLRRALKRIKSFSSLCSYYISRDR